MIVEVSGQLDVRSYYSSTGSGLCTFPLAVTEGDLVIVAGAVWDETTELTTITVSKNSGSATIGGFNTILTGSGITWAGGFLYSYLGYAVVTGSGVLQVLTTVVGGSGSWAMNFMVDEFNGIDPVAVLDVNGSYVNGATSVPTDNITTLSDDALIIGVMATSGGGGSFAPGSGYTQLWEDETGTYAPYSVEYKIAGGPGTYAVDWSSGAQDTWTIVNASFKQYVPIVPVGPGASVVSASPLRNRIW